MAEGEKAAHELIHEKIEWLRTPEAEQAKYHDRVPRAWSLVDYYLIRDELREARYWQEQYKTLYSYDKLGQSYNCHIDGVISEVEENWEDALAFYDAAVRAAPVYPYLFSRAYAQMRLERPEEAARDFCDAIVDANRQYKTGWQKCPDIALRFRILCRYSYLKFKPFGTLHEVRDFIETHGTAFRKEPNYKQAIYLLDRTIRRGYDAQPVFDRGGYTQRLPEVVE